MVMVFSDVLVIKELVAKKFDGLYLHFHDGCGNQYFSFDEPAGEDVKEFLTEYFHEKGGTVEFTGDEVFAVR